MYGKTNRKTTRSSIRSFYESSKLQGTAFHILIGGAGENSYFRWLFDALPRIHFLKKTGWFDMTDCFIMPGYKTKYQKASLKMLRIDEARVVEGKDTYSSRPFNREYRVEESSFSNITRVVKASEGFGHSIIEKF